jgi:hypothetical protein
MIMYIISAFLKFFLVAGGRAQDDLTLLGSSNPASVSRVAGAIDVYHDV